MEMFDSEPVPRIILIDGEPFPCGYTRPIIRNNLKGTIPRRVIKKAVKDLMAARNITFPDQDVSSPTKTRKKKS